MTGHRVGVAMGPLYQTDPAEQLLAPFVRSARQTGWEIETEEELAPAHVLDAARAMRATTAIREFVRVQPLDGAGLVEEWTRAGLVLEIASRRGIKVIGRGILNCKWKLCGTVTGRFGVESIGGFNPMIIKAEDRWRLVPNGDDRKMAMIDFRAMDVWSMISVVPGLAELYADCEDPHSRTASIIWMCVDPTLEQRELIKREIFVHAYGGNSMLKSEFQSLLPELDFLRKLPHGEGARLVQRTSAAAFRAGLSAALPLLLRDEVRPMITVHDELVLDVLGGHEMTGKEVARMMGVGASQRIGQPYTTKIQWGSNYGEVKE